jgi:hypothetical protein
MRLSLSVAAQPARPAPQARAAQPAFRLSQIKHVWVIQVENEGYTQSFGKPAVDPYLARTLPREGALLTNYYSIGHHSLDNYIAEISGQAPNTLSQEDCPKWAPLPDDIVGPYHQVLDTKGGCVFPLPCRRWATSCRPRSSPGRRTWRTWGTTRRGIRPHLPTSRVGSS